MNYTICSNKKYSNLKIFIYYIFYQYTFFQIFGILRATDIYNTAYIFNISNIIISLFIVLMFIFDLKIIKVNKVELFLMFYPILTLPYGIITNGFNRNTLSQLFTSIVFAILICYTRNTNFNFSSILQNKFANLMFKGLFLSIVFYKIAPILGLRVYSVGVVSIYFIFPLIVFFQYGVKIKLYITFILLILGGKRGVLLSGLISFFIIALGQKNIKKSTRLIIFLLTICLIISLFYLSISPKKILLLPKTLRPMFTRMMNINPFSIYNNIGNDARIREAISALEPIIEKPIYIITGRGVGYSYNYLGLDGNYVKELHNTHISPVAIIARFGIIYTFILYGYIIRTIHINYKKMRKNRLSLEKTVLLIYLISSFINSFTAFTIYIDYLFGFSLGILNVSNEKNKFSS